MKNIISILFIIFLFLTGRVKATDEYNHGLYLRSHAHPSLKRTTLLLEDDQPLSFKNEFTIAFKMYIRPNEPDFGSILHLKTNTDQYIHFSLVASEHKHYPAMVFNEGIVQIETPIEREKWMDVAIHLKPLTNTIELEYDQKKSTATISLQHVKQVTAQFGRIDNYIADVAPVNIRDIIIIQDGAKTREWALSQHNNDICYDTQAKAVARAIYPDWLIDNHIEWKEIFKKEYPEKTGIAFNARDAIFYLLKPNSIELLDDTGCSIKAVNVLRGYPAMEFPSHLLYDTLTNQIVSYYLKEGKTSSFKFMPKKWSNDTKILDEPSHSNHAKTFNPADSSFYFFGGYGFYQYRNELYCMKSGSYEINKIEYERPINPRYSAAMAAVGDEIYIFGGRGNKYGKQELSSNYYFGLYAINLKKRTSRTVWQMNNPPKEGTLMGSSMYFEPSDSSFYAISMESGGILWKISMNDSVITKVSKPILNEEDYQDYEFNLYKSNTHKKLFVVLNKIKSNRSQSTAIYSLNLPLITEQEIWPAGTEDSNTGHKPYKLLLGMIFLLAAGVGVWNLLKRRKRDWLDATSTTSVHNDVDSKTETKLNPDNEQASVEPVNYYDRTHACISLFGCFNVRDKEGNDITSNFTPRLKNLLILLILYSEKYPQGILANKATELLWPDKDENAARNNRNVTLRKLRILLESVGDVQIITENNFLRIEWGKEVFCDYHTLMVCIKQFTDEKNDQILNQILELLLFGPLLPNTILDWLDEFKDTSSSRSIDLLKDLLDKDIQQGNQEMIIRLSNIMFLHDPLNEEALSAKCAVLVAQGKKGIARNVYDRFAKEYRESMGEDFKTPFADL